MSIWKRKKNKLAKTEKPEKEESVLKDFVDTLTYDKTEEEKKKSLTQMDADDKIVAVPTVGVGPQSSQVVTQAGPQQIVININIPAPLNKSEMNPEHKADMPKAPPLPKVPTITAKAPAAPRTPVIHTATVVQKSEEKPSLSEVIKSLPADKAMAILNKIKPGKNLKKNMTQGYAGQPPSNLMQMSQEPLKKDVVDMKSRTKIGESGQDIPGRSSMSTGEKIKEALSGRNAISKPLKEKSVSSFYMPFHNSQEMQSILNSNGPLTMGELHHIKSGINESDKVLDLSEDLPDDVLDYHSNFLAAAQKRIENSLKYITEPLKKDVVDMSKWKRRSKDKKEDNQRGYTSNKDAFKDILVNPKDKPDTRSRDQKISDALSGQGKKDDGMHAGKAGGNFRSRTTKEQQKRAHLAPVKEQPQKPDNLQSRLDNWTKRNKGKIDKLPENSKLKRDLADKIKGALERQASMMDTSPEANEKRKKTLEDAKRILSERKT